MFTTVKLVRNLDTVACLNGLFGRKNHYSDKSCIYWNSAHTFNFLLPQSRVGYTFVVSKIYSISFSCDVCSLHICLSHSTDNVETGILTDVWAQRQTLGTLHSSHSFLAFDVAPLTNNKHTPWPTVCTDIKPLNRVNCTRTSISSDTYVYGKLIY